MGYKPTPNKRYFRPSRLSFWKVANKSETQSRIANFFTIISLSADLARVSRRFYSKKDAGNEENMTCLHVNKRKYVTLHSDWEKSLSVTFWKIEALCYPLVLSLKFPTFPTYKTSITLLLLPVCLGRDFSQSDCKIKEFWRQSINKRLFLSVGELFFTWYTFRKSYMYIRFFLHVHIVFLRCTSTKSRMYICVFLNVHLENPECALRNF